MCEGRTWRMHRAREKASHLFSRAGETWISSFLTWKQSNEIEVIFEKCFSGTLGLKV